MCKCHGTGGFDAVFLEGLFQADDAQRLFVTRFRIVLLFYQQLDIFTGFNADAACQFSEVFGAPIAVESVRTAQMFLVGHVLPRAISSLVDGNTVTLVVNLYGVLIVLQLNLTANVAVGGTGIVLCVGRGNVAYLLHLGPLVMLDLVRLRRQRLKVLLLQVDKQFAAAGLVGFHQVGIVLFKLDTQLGI